MKTLLRLRQHRPSRAIRVHADDEAVRIVPLKWRVELRQVERACEGIFLAFQYPIELPGVSNEDFLRLAYNSKREYYGEPPVDPLEFMMEERAGDGGRRAPSQLAVFACGDGGARPTLTNLHAFLNDMARLCRYTLECNVVALILLIRFFSYQKNLRLAPATWRRYLLCALMIAQKFWDDRCLRNIDFTIAWRCVLPDAGQVDLRDVNLMERHFLAGLGYDLYIQPAKYSACLSEVLSIVVDEADPPPAAPPPTAPPPAAPPPGKP